MESIDAGDIGAGVGFKDIRTGDTLCDEAYPIVLESMTFPDTVISIAVEPKSQADIAKLDNGLAKLADTSRYFAIALNTIFRGQTAATCAVSPRIHGPKSTETKKSA